MCWRCLHQLQGRSPFSGELWLARPSQPLVPIPLGVSSDGGQQWDGVAMTGGVGCNGHSVIGKYAVQWWH
jgi:hypothetical protein